MGASSEADTATPYVSGSHCQHSDRTRNVVHSPMDPCFRTVLIALRSARQILESQKAIATQAERQEQAICQLQSHVNRQG